jgi:predicted nucleic acid-binding protein
MTVVSNTSPINYLTLIGLNRPLPALFGRVIVPLAVQEELQSPGAPPQIGEMLRPSGGWLDVVSASPVSEPILAGLDAGEKDGTGGSGATDKALRATGRARQCNSVWRTP